MSLHSIEFGRPVDMSRMDLNRRAPGVPRGGAGAGGGSGRGRGGGSGRRVGVDGHGLMSITEDDETDISDNSNSSLTGGVGGGSGGSDQEFLGVSGERARVMSLNVSAGEPETETKTLRDMMGKMTDGRVSLLNAQQARRLRGRRRSFAEDNAALPSQTTSEKAGAPGSSAKMLTLRNGVFRTLNT